MVRDPHDRHTVDIEELIVRATQREASMIHPSHVMGATEEEERGTIRCSVRVCERCGGEELWQLGTHHLDDVLLAFCPFGERPKRREERDE